MFSNKENMTETEMQVQNNVPQLKMGQFKIVLHLLKRRIVFFACLLFVFYLPYLH